MPSNHLIFYCPLLLLPSIFPCTILYFYFSIHYSEFTTKGFHHHTINPLSPFCPSLLRPFFYGNYYSVFCIYLLLFCLFFFFLLLFSYSTDEWHLKVFVFLHLSRISSFLQLVLQCVCVCVCAGAYIYVHMGAACVLHHLYPFTPNQALRLLPCRVLFSLSQT